MRLGISKEKASRLVVTLAVALACVMVPASVMAIVGKQLGSYEGSAGYSLTGVPASGWATGTVTASVSVTDTAALAAGYRLWPADEDTPSAITTGAPAVATTSTAGHYKLESGYVHTATADPTEFIWSEVHEFGIDSTAPTTTATSTVDVDLSKWQSNDVTMTLSAIDDEDGSGVESTFYSIDGAAASLYTLGDLLPFTNGMKTLKFWSVDKAGNSETTQTVVVKVDTVDPKSTSSLVELADGTQRLTIVATDTPSGVASIKASINGQQWYTVASAADEMMSPLNGIVDLSVAGTNTVEYVVEDYAGNREETKTVEAIVSRTTQIPLTQGSRNLTNTKIPTRTAIKGTLRDGDVVLAGEEVTLWSADNASMEGEQLVATKTTDVDGSFSFWASLSNKTYYRVKFGGVADKFDPAASRIVRVTPRVELSTPKASKGTKYAGRSFSVTGRVEPGHNTGTRVYLKRYLYSAKSKSYVYKGRTAVKVKRLSSASSAYSAGMRLGAGKWEIRAYMPGDSLHTKSTSKALRVTVR